jgi:hypothetical protein
MNPSDESTLTSNQKNPTINENKANDGLTENNGKEDYSSKKDI